MAISSKEELFKLIEEEAKQSEAGLDGAFLSHLLVHKHGDPVKKLGFAKLSDAIREAEQCGYVKRDTSVKHLLIVPNSHPTPRTSPPNKKLYICNEYWKALFLNDSESISYRFDKSLEKLIECQSSTPLESDQVALDAVPKDIQLTWMKGFFEREDIPLTRSLDSYWPNASALGNNVSSRWKRERSAKAIALLSKWAQENRIDEANIFQRIVSSCNQTRINSDSDGDNLLRESIVTAVKQMSHSRLLALSAAIVVDEYGLKKTD